MIKLSDPYLKAVYSRNHNAFKQWSCPTHLRKYKKVYRTVIARLKKFLKRIGGGVLAEFCLQKLKMRVLFLIIIFWFII